MTAIGRAATTRTASERQSTRRLLTSTQGYTFTHTLTPAQQDAWFLAGQKMVDLSGNPRPKDAYGAFFTVNSLLYSVQGPGHILLTPGSLTPPEPLPGVTLAAKYAIPAAGRKVALKLRAITNTGVAGPYYLVTTIVGLTDAEACGTDGAENNTTLKAG